MKNKIIVITGFIAASALHASVALAGPVQHTFTTQLEEVRTGSFNGQEYLTVQISGNVGPASCRGNVLKIDTSAMKSEAQQQQLETTALSAMLNDEDVRVTVGLDRADCVDGKPTLVDLYILN